MKGECVTYVNIDVIFRRCQDGLSNSLGGSFCSGQGDGRGVILNKGISQCFEDKLDAMITLDVLVTVCPSIKVSVLVVVLAQPQFADIGL